MQIPYWVPYLIILVGMALKGIALNKLNSKKAIDRREGNGYAIVGLACTVVGLLLLALPG